MTTPSPLPYYIRIANVSVDDPNAQYSFECMSCGEVGTLGSQLEANEACSIHLLANQSCNTFRFRYVSSLERGATASVVLPSNPLQLLLEKAALTKDEVEAVIANLQEKLERDGADNLTAKEIVESMFAINAATAKKAVAVALEAVGDPLAKALDGYRRPWKCYCRSKPYGGKHATGR